MKKSSNIINVKNFVFIVGSPKSGTTWLHILLASHKKVTGTVELSLFNNYISPLIKSWATEADNILKEKWFKGLPFILNEDEFFTMLKEFIATVYEKVLKLSPEATHILDKNPTYAFHLDEIDMFFPKARIIHIIRDGRDVASSLSHVKKNIGYGTSDIIEAAQLWKNSVRAAGKGKKNNEKYLEIKYEELLNNGKETMKRVYEFCGLKITETEIEKILDEHSFEKMKEKNQHMDKRVKTNPEFYRRGTAGGWREEFSVMDRYSFNKTAGDLLIKLGYAERSWWAASLFQKLFYPPCYSVKNFIIKVLKLIRRAFKSLK